MYLVFVYLVCVLSVCVLRVRSHSDKIVLEADKYLEGVCILSV